MCMLVCLKLFHIGCRGLTSKLGSEAKGPLLQEELKHMVMGMMSLHGGTMQWC